MAANVTAPPSTLGGVALAVAADPVAGFAAIRFRGPDILEVIDAGTPDVEGVLVSLAARLPFVTADTSRTQALLAALSAPTATPVWDVMELATLLDSSTPVEDLDAAASHLGLERVETGLEGDARLVWGMFSALLGAVEALDSRVLLQVMRLAAPLDWPLKHLFVEVERQRARATLGSSSGAEPSVEEGAPDEPGGRRRRQTIAPLSRPRLLDPRAVAAAFAPGGSIARALPGYEPRAEQARMAEAVAAALNDGGQVLIEAGTGTGKSLAYLVPAAEAALRNGWRTVISTATTTLQDQLYAKDLPTVIRALDAAATVRATVLKGRANYLCLHRWEELLAEPRLDSHERHLLLKTLFWVARTSTGDRAELRLTAREEEAWQRLSAVGEVCTPAHCAYNRQGVCFLARARRAAEESHLVIVNHALLLSDLAAGSRVLPEYQALVVDEAHQLEDEATAQLGWRLGERELLAHVDRVWIATNPNGGRGPGGALAEGLAALDAYRKADGSGADSGTGRAATQAQHAAAGCARALRASFAALAAVGQSANPVRAEDDVLSARVTSGLRNGSAWETLETTWAGAARGLLELAQLCADVEGRLDLAAGPDDALRTIAIRLRAEIDFWQETRERLDTAIHRPDDGFVYWLSAARGGPPFLHAAPIDVSEVLRHELFGVPHASILVSATLAVDGTFGYVKRRLGLDEADALAVGSPFDFREAALLYVPYDVPEPTQPGYQALLERLVFESIASVGGRTLVLFTSHSQLRSTYLALREPLADRGILLLGQGLDEGSRTQLLDTFRRGGGVALFGTSSFWEGVDVIGEALSAVIVARLPFAVPSDPIYAARAEQFDDPFSQYAVPRAVLRFKQGFGRLIRARGDRGVVVVLDRRLITRKYGAAFVQSLPPCTVRQGPAARTAATVLAWLSGSG